MVAYILELVRDVTSKCNAGIGFGELRNLLYGLTQELDRLDPRDFITSAQYPFLKVQLAARKWSHAQMYSGPISYPEIRQLMADSEAVLKQYGGEGSRAVVRTFSFITDSGLRAIVERDYRELTHTVFPSRSWKSTVVLAGSILEAILYDQLTKDAATISKAEADLNAFKRNGKVVPLNGDRWSLEALIAVSESLGFLPPQRAKSIDQILRDYRNFIHPKKEVRSKHACTEAEAMLAIGALDSVCNHLK